MADLETTLERLAVMAWNLDGERQETVLSAIELLKAQEPVLAGEKIESLWDTPDFYDCGFCKNAIRKPWNYCPFCGKAVKWDG